MSEVVKVSIMQAIARQEGFYVRKSRAERNHNPGNINYGIIARMFGAKGPDDKGYAVFTRAKDGWGALEFLLKGPAYRGKTVEEMIHKYAPSKGDPRGDNDTATYIKNVCDWCQITPKTVIDQHINA
jgi:hypothetical protein